MVPINEIDTADPLDAKLQNKEKMKRSNVAPQKLQAKSTKAKR